MSSLSSESWAALILGISPDGAQKHEAFHQEVRTEVLAVERSREDRHGEVRRLRREDDVRQEGAGVIRSTFVIDPKGLVERAFYNVRADGHAAKVLAGPIGLTGALTSHRAKAVPKAQCEKQHDHDDDGPLRVLKVIRDVVPVRSRRRTPAR